MIDERKNNTPWYFHNTCLFSACNCDPEGSLDMQCDDYGNCPCIEGVEGKRCDRCMENKYNITAGCIGKP